MTLDNLIEKLTELQQQGHGSMPVKAWIDSEWVHVRPVYNADDEGDFIELSELAEPHPIELIRAILEEDGFAITSSGWSGPAGDLDNIHRSMNLLIPGGYATVSFVDGDIVAMAAREWINSGSPTTPQKDILKVPIEDPTAFQKIKTFLNEWAPS